MTEIASTTGTLRQTTPESPAEELDSAFSIDYGSDPKANIHHDLCKDKNRLQARVSKLKAQLGEVECARKTTRQRLKEKARKIKNEILEVECDGTATDRRQS